MQQSKLKNKVDQSASIKVDRKKAKKNVILWAEKDDFGEKKGTEIKAKRNVLNIIEF